MEDYFIIENYQDGEIRKYYATNTVTFYNGKETKHFKTVKELVDSLTRKKSNTAAKTDEKPKAAARAVASKKA